MDPVTWLAEAYEKPINESDTGYVWRNIQAASVLADLLPRVSSEDDYFCDYGGGYGLLVRLMRDRGFRFHWFDIYTPNLFCPYTSASSAFSYKAVIACEVFEHLPDPVTELAAMLKFSNLVLFTTELVPGGELLDWDYLGLYHGQHISFYGEASLSALAKSFGLIFGNLGMGWHAIGPENMIRNLVATGSVKRTLIERVMSRIAGSQKAVKQSREPLFLADHAGIVRATVEGRLKSFHLDGSRTDKVTH